MKKILFCILPLLVLGSIASPLMAKSKFSFSFNLHSLLPPPTVYEEHVYVHPAPPPPPCYEEKRVIRRYYPAPYQEEVVQIRPYSPYYPYNHAAPYCY